MTPFGNRVETFKYKVWQALAGLEGRHPGHQPQLGHLRHPTAAASSSTSATATSAAPRSPASSTAPPTTPAMAAPASAMRGTRSATIRSARAASHMPGAPTTASTRRPRRSSRARSKARCSSFRPANCKFAVGADYRAMRLQLSAGRDLDHQRFARLRLGQRRVGQRRTCHEVFGELLVPMLKDMPFAKDALARSRLSLFQIQPVSAQSTWKADVSWAAGRRRSGSAAAIRSPSARRAWESLRPDHRRQSQHRYAPNAGDPCDVNSIFRTGANAAQVQTLCARAGRAGRLLSDLHLWLGLGRRQRRQQPQTDAGKGRYLFVRRGDLAEVRRAPVPQHSSSRSTTTTSRSPTRSGRCC